ncbi:hypothetical protein MP228_003040 [Amoeboaphelidium protococcarum]|nr:hypothetical protein MP228_003040 [Amoeboaphelidium protococcarum]
MDMQQQQLRNRQPSSVYRPEEASMISEIGNTADPQYQTLSKKQQQEQLVQEDSAEQKQLKKMKLQALKSQVVQLTALVSLVNGLRFLCMVLTIMQLFPGFGKLDIISSYFAGGNNFQSALGDSSASQGTVFYSDCDGVVPETYHRVYTGPEGFSYNKSYVQFNITAAVPKCQLSGCLLDLENMTLISNVSSPSPSCKLPQDALYKNSYMMKCMLTGGYRSSYAQMFSLCLGPNGQSGQQFLNGQFFSQLCMQNTSTALSEQKEAFVFRSSRLLYYIPFIQRFSQSAGVISSSMILTDSSIFSATLYQPGYFNQWYNSYNNFGSYIRANPQEALFPLYRSVRYAVYPQTWAGNISDVFKTSFWNFMVSVDSHAIQCQTISPSGNWTDYKPPVSNAINSFGDDTMYTNSLTSLRILLVSCLVVFASNVMLEVVKVLILLFSLCSKMARNPKTMIFAIDSPMMLLFLFAPYYRTMCLYAMQKRNPRYRTVPEFFVVHCFEFFMITASYIVYGPLSDLIKGYLALCVSTIVVNFATICWHCLQAMEVDRSVINKKLIELF